MLVVSKLFCILSGFGPCSFTRAGETKNFYELKKHIWVNYIFCAVYCLFLCFLTYLVCETVSLYSLWVFETHCIGQAWLQTWTPWALVLPNSNHTLSVFAWRDENNTSFSPSIFAWGILRVFSMPDFKKGKYTVGAVHCWSDRYPVHCHESYYTTAFIYWETWKLLSYYLFTFNSFFVVQ